MGLFWNNKKDNKIRDVEAFNKRVLQREEEKIKRKKEKINQIRHQFNIYTGINCKVQFPHQELVLKSHSGLKRGLATFGFGLVGFAATSNVKQEKEYVIKDTQLQIVDKGIVFKKVTDDGKDLRVPYDNIISFTLFAQKNNKYYELLLLENQSLIVSLTDQLKNNELEIITQDLVDVINGRATGKYYEEVGWGLESNKTPNVQENENSTSDANTSIAELEKIVNMYEKGLLTDEEFAAMKSKIIKN